MSENLLKWYAEYEDHTHGASSECIARAYVMRDNIQSIPTRAINSIPLDSEDFWRCMKLCYMAPVESAIGLGVLAKHSSKWRILYKYWDEIKSCYPNNDSILKNTTRPNDKFEICQKTLKGIFWQNIGGLGYINKQDSDIDWDKLPKSLLEGYTK